MASKRKNKKKAVSAVTLAVALLASTLAANLLTASAEATSVVAAPPIVWQHEYMNGDGYSIYQLPDGGYVFNAANETATFLVKTDSFGNITSTKAIQIYQKPTVLPYFVQTLDGGYAFAGNMSDLYALVKTDSEGNILWSKTYNSNTPFTYMRAMIQTRDGDFALAGFGQLNPEDVGWSWFARTDASGNLLWNKTLSAQFDCPSAIIEEPNGDFTLSDVIFSLEPNYTLFRLVRTDKNGGILWSKTYGEMGENDTYRTPECNTIIATIDGGYLIAGWLAKRNAWVVKTDAAGVMLWNQTYGEADSAVVCAKQTIDGGYIFAAVQNVREAWLLKADSLGSQVWNVAFSDAMFHGAFQSNYNSVIQTIDGGYVVLGVKDGAVWVTKLMYPETDLLGQPQIQVAIVVVVAACVLFGLVTILKRGKHSAVSVK
jgi:hypothetical protein